MRFSNHIYQLMSQRLIEHRIVVWYDSERAFGDFARAFTAANCRVVSAIESELAARRLADEIYRQMNESAQPSEANVNLLIYLPRARATGEARTRDPFEVFAVAGAVFGESDAEQVPALARAAMPELAEQIDTLFLTGTPTLALLDELRASSSYPQIENALGTQSPVEVCALVIGSDSAAEKVGAAKGVQVELVKLMVDGIGFALPEKIKAWKKIREAISTYVLISELAFDLPGALPDALANVPRAEMQHRDRIYAICDRLRSSDDTRDTYRELARHIEDEMKLRDHFRGVTQLGTRDTFPFEERQYLTNLDAAIQRNDIAAARAIIEGRRQSVWRHQPERAQIWQVVERCVNLIEATANVGDKVTSVRGMIEAYTRVGGWGDVDRQQRLMEQSWSDCADCGEALSIVEFARRRYRASIDRMQERFLRAVQNEGWHPEGILRQTQVFDRFVAPVLARRDKIAYVLADSLRFEMGRALADELATLGDVTIVPATATLPTMTPNGMASLLPGADGALNLRVSGDDIVPHIGARAFPDSNARMKLLAETFGDRFTDVTLNDWLDATDRKRVAIAKAQLLVLRVPDIDELAEHVSPRQARKYMSDLLGELKIAVTKLALAGYSTIVFAADHGHVLFPEILAGDTLQSPSGTWQVNKRRAKLGTYLKEQAGSLILKTSHLGIQTDVPDYCVPNGFGVYASDATYFHEGLSLQECIIPVIELRVKGQIETSGKKQEIEIRYPRPQFTSQVIGLKVYYASMFGESLRIRLEAYPDSDSKSKPIGEAADCTARDENTHEITLQPNAETEVPLLINPDFKGPSVEIRAMPPGETGVVWHRLKLKNGILD
ncbi:hypothetical protein ANRL3_02882 [Anaerolineae bacterium]|nr:hypothetical protein ANRL3_02882 [Anaerolineae bacterium]